MSKSNPTLLESNSTEPPAPVPFSQESGELETSGQGQHTDWESVWMQIGSLNSSSSGQAQTILKLQAEVKKLQDQMPQAGSVVTVDEVKKKIDTITSKWTTIRNGLDTLLESLDKQLKPFKSDKKLQDASALTRDFIARLEDISAQAKELRTMVDAELVWLGEQPGHVEAANATQIKSELDLHAAALKTNLIGRLTGLIAAANAKANTPNALSGWRKVQNALKLAKKDIEGLVK